MQPRKITDEADARADGVRNPHKGRRVRKAREVREVRKVRVVRRVRDVRKVVDVVHHLPLAQTAVAGKGDRARADSTQGHRDGAQPVASANIVLTR